MEKGRKEKRNAEIIEIAKVYLKEKGHHRN
jgi:hypothetical protein